MYNERYLRAARGDVHCVALDVTDAATVRAAAEEIAERFQQLDVLINNAGVTGPRALGTADLDVVRAIFETDVFGVIVKQMSRTAAEAASVAVRLATLDDDGPTGGFFDDNGRVPW